MEKFYNVQEAAAQFECSDKQVRAMCRSGQLEYTMIGREYRFLAEWLMDTMRRKIRTTKRRGTNGRTLQAMSRTEAEPLHHAHPEV